MPSLTGDIKCLERSPTASMGTNKIEKMSGIIGKKVGMTSIFDETGKNIPCTVIEAGPCVVTQVKIC